MVYVTHRKSLPRIERQEAGWYRGYDVSSLFGEEAFFMFKKYGSPAAGGRYRHRRHKRSVWFTSL